MVDAILIAVPYPVIPTGWLGGVWRGVARDFPDMLFGVVGKLFTPDELGGIRVVPFIERYPLTRPLTGVFPIEVLRVLILLPDGVEETINA